MFQDEAAGIAACECRNLVEYVAAIGRIKGRVIHDADQRRQLLLSFHKLFVSINVEGATSAEKFRLISSDGKYMSTTFQPKIVFPGRCCRIVDRRFPQRRGQTSPQTRAFPTSAWRGGWRPF